MMWQPTATLEKLQSRAVTLAKIREFFAYRHVLEVETPLLGKTSATDPYITSFETTFSISAQPTIFYLQTSPEFAMKRLLAAGCGSIYQITKAFRKDEKGTLHNPEFTLLEWYRLDYNHHQLMDEVDELLQYTLSSNPAKRMSYQDLFYTHLTLDPHNCELKHLQNCAIEHNIQVNNAMSLDKDDWLQLLLSHLIEPHLGFEQPFFVYDFPASQAALSRIRQDEKISVAERFEVYIQGIEIANGYHELNDSHEQYQRFLADNLKRQQQGIAEMPIDERLLMALSEGFPTCAGVALGIDRLIMLATSSTSIGDVISFTTEHA